jgi:hypothetical protein
MVPPFPWPGLTRPSRAKPTNAATSGPWMAASEGGHDGGVGTKRQLQNTRWRRTSVEPHECPDREARHRPMLSLIRPVATANGRARGSGAGLEDAAQYGLICGGSEPPGPPDQRLRPVPRHGSITLNCACRLRHDGPIGDIKGPKRSSEPKRSSTVQHVSVRPCKVNYEHLARLDIMILEVSAPNRAALRSQARRPCRAW